MISVTFYQYVNGVTVSFIARVLLVSEALLILLDAVLLVPLQILPTTAPDRKLAFLGSFRAKFPDFDFFTLISRKKVIH